MSESGFNVQANWQIESLLIEAICERCLVDVDVSVCDHPCMAGSPTIKAIDQLLKVIVRNGKFKEVVDPQIVVGFELLLPMHELGPEHRRANSFLLAMQCIIAEKTKASFRRSDVAGYCLMFLDERHDLYLAWLATGVLIRRGTTAQDVEGRKLVGSLIRLCLESAQDGPQ